MRNTFGFLLKYPHLGILHIKDSVTNALSKATGSEIGGRYAIAIVDVTHI